MLFVPVLKIVTINIGSPCSLYNATIIYSKDHQAEMSVYHLSYKI